MQRNLWVQFRTPLLVDCILDCSLLIVPGETKVKFVLNLLDLTNNNPNTSYCWYFVCIGNHFQSRTLASSNKVESCWRITMARVGLVIMFHVEMFIVIQLRHDVMEYVFSRISMMQSHQWLFISFVICYFSFFNQECPLNDSCNTN